MNISHADEETSKCSSVFMGHTFKLKAPIFIIFQKSLQCKCMLPSTENQKLSPAIHKHACINEYCFWETSMIEK